MNRNDETEISELFRSLEAAGHADDVKAAAKHFDFPFISTSVVNGEVVSHSFSEQEFLTTLKPSSEKDEVHIMAPHQPRVVKWVGHEVVFVEEHHEVGSGALRQEWTAISQLVKKNGEWKLKSMTDNAGVTPFSKCLYCLFKSACCKPLALSNE